MGTKSNITPGKRPPSDGTWQAIIIGSEPRVGSRRVVGGPRRLELPASTTAKVTAGGTFKHEDRAKARPGEELGRVILHDARQNPAKYCA